MSDIQITYKPKKDAIIVQLLPDGKWFVSVECQNEENIGALGVKAKRILDFINAEQL